MFLTVLHQRGTCVPLTQSCNTAAQKNVTEDRWFCIAAAHVRRSEVNTIRDSILNAAGRRQTTEHLPFPINLFTNRDKLCCNREPITLSETDGAAAKQGSAIIMSLTCLQKLLCKG